MVWEILKFILPTNYAVLSLLRLFSDMNIRQQKEINIREMNSFNEHMLWKDQEP